MLELKTNRRRILIGTNMLSNEIYCYPMKSIHSMSFRTYTYKHHLQSFVVNNIGKYMITFYEFLLIILTHLETDNYHSSIFKKLPSNSTDRLRKSIEIKLE